MFRVWRLIEPSLSRQAAGQFWHGLAAKAAFASSEFSPSKVCIRQKAGAVRRTLSLLHARGSSFNLQPSCTRRQPCAAPLRDRYNSENGCIYSVASAGIRQWPARAVPVDKRLIDKVV